MKKQWAAALLVGASAWAARGADEWPAFNVDWRAGVESPADVSFLLPAPAGKDGFIQVKDGHFVRPDGSRLRIWGLNATGAAGLPATNNAPAIAAALARRGINCIRFHFLDQVGTLIAADRDDTRVQNGLACSRDGITNWQRHPANPIVRPDTNEWDHDACYKPAALFDGQCWLLWYNGRHGHLEQIGVALHEGEDLSFERRTPMQ